MRSGFCFCHLHDQVCDGDHDVFSDLPDQHHLLLLLHLPHLEVNPKPVMIFLISHTMKSRDHLPDGLVLVTIDVWLLSLS